MSVAHQHTGPWPHQGPWTADDVLALPDDDIRYEVVDGAPRHQSVSFRLHELWRSPSLSSSIRRAWSIVSRNLA